MVVIFAYHVLLYGTLGSNRSSEVGSAPEAAETSDSVVAGFVFTVGPPVVRINDVRGLEAAQTPGDLLAALRGYAPGDTVRLTAVRDGDERLIGAISGSQGG